jgi:hypothetical protein
MSYFTEEQTTIVKRRIEDGRYSDIANIVWKLEEYAMRHIGQGHFLTAVLENDLFTAFNRADSQNQRRMFRIAQYTWNNLPMKCYGSTKRVETWLERKDA